MFETAELGRTLAKSKYDARVPALRTEMLALQQQLKDAPFSVVVLVGGLEASGRGEVVNVLHEWMDPRFLETHAFARPTDEEKERPYAWRFWRAMPARGRVGLWFGSWYTGPFVNRVGKRNTKADFERSLEGIRHHEKSLSGDGVLLIKVWLHISKKDQKKRLKSLESNPDTAWRVTPEDWAAHDKHSRACKVATRMLRSTSTADAPWHVVEAHDARYRNITVAEHLMATIRARLEAEAPSGGVVAPGVLSTPGADGPQTILDTIDLSQKLDKRTYEKALLQTQGRLNKLVRRMQAENRSLVLAFEGWDAAGKGGNIRRIAHAMDARDYTIIPIAAPTEEERAHHYMWRFWRHVPRAGKVAIFDRTWYGRVLVERVEGFATEAEWRRAYEELNAFEEQLTTSGVVVMKFWLHIDKDEQLARFKAREVTPYKQHKITEEDYRNREKWDAYAEAIDEMVARTSTEFAPWNIIAGNDKRFARVDVLRRICERLEAELD